MKQLDNLYKIRTCKGLTRQSLAKISGVNQTTIQRLENGVINADNVKLSTLIKLAKALNIKVIDLVDKPLKKFVA